MPCLESAVLALAEIENAAAVKEAATLYQDLMAQRAKLPTENVQELLELHSQCEQEALELFMARAFKDDICRFQADLIVGAPQPSQDSPRDTISPLAFGPGVPGSPCLLPEDSAVPSPEPAQSQRLLSHSADWQLSLLHYSFSLGSEAVLQWGRSSALPLSRCSPEVSLPWLEACSLPHFPCPADQFLSLCFVEPVVPGMLSAPVHLGPEMSMGMDCPPHPSPPS